MRNFLPLGKAPKFTPKLQGPAKVTELNDTNARIQLSSGKTKVHNVMPLKMFYTPAQSYKQNIESENSPFHFNSEPKLSGPITRAMKRLIEHKCAVQLEINILCDLSKEHCTMCEWEQECLDNPLLFCPIYAHHYIKE
jgi:hypothetical protein